MPSYQIYFDTLEGEKRYDVDIGETEPIEIVLRDIVVDLSERGHTMRGLAAGDLKVIWGGREGRELDQSRTLPEQGVRPNDVLRILVEIYEGGGRTIRADRIEKEWMLLERLARANPGMVEVVGRDPSPIEDVFHVRLHQSPGIEGVDRGVLKTRTSHTFRFSFPRFYPEVPVDCHVAEPLFHPNVKPESGFVCLWEQARRGDTVIQAVARAQAVAALRMVNIGANHLMNTEAAAWYQTVGVPQGLVPLTWDEIKVFEVLQGEIHWIEPGRQLSSSARML